MRRFSSILPVVLASSGCTTSTSVFDPHPTPPWDDIQPRIDASTADVRIEASAEGMACSALVAKSAYSCGTVQFQFPNECQEVACRELCTLVCGAPVSQCEWVPISASTPPHTLNCTLNGCGGSSGGRRPSGLLEAPCQSTLAAFFSDASRLEAASVVAFQILERELRSNDAPHDLVKRARVSAKDEIRHTRRMVEVARRFGGEYVRPVIEKHAGPRTLEAIAIENAIEGCVGESFAAVLARWQADHARDGFVAKTLDAIAVDEARHADLAWDVHAWIMTKLDERAQARVTAAMEAAVVRLQASIAMPSDPLALAGIPSDDVARRLASTLEHVLWAA